MSIVRLSLLVSALFAFFFAPTRIDGRLRALKYDVECPFLTDREYQERMVRGRCPFKMLVANKTNTSPTPPPNLKHGLLSANAQKKLLKFVYFGKQRTSTIPMKRDRYVESKTTEGTFVEIDCDVSKNEVNETQIRWFFDGLPLDPSVFDWRVQSANRGQRIVLAPTLEQYDNGLFECYVDEDFRGGLHLKVVTIWSSVLRGFQNYLIGLAFSFPLVVVASAYRLFRPEQRLQMDSLFESTEKGEEEELNLEFDEIMLNLRKAERQT